MLLVLLLPILLQPAKAAPGKPAAEEIFELSDSAPRDSAVQQRALERIDAELARAPQVALNHYTRGRILSRLQRDPEALQAYDAALVRDPKFANAEYNAGAVLARLGRTPEAAARFDRALDLEPLTDAAYNAGQAYYDMKDFEKSLARFQRARSLDPSDFNAAKKVMQAALALGREDEAWAARKDVIRIWKTSSDPSVRRLKEYVLDQFVVGSLHVLAFETLAPAEDLAYVYTFRALDEGDTTVGTVQLETSAVIRELGTPYLMGVSRGSVHESPGIGFKKLPKYLEVRAAATKLIAERLAR